LNEKDFIFSKSKELQLSGLKSFPAAFTDLKQSQTIDVPDKQLLLGKEFFGSFEVTTPSGDFVLTFSNENKAKYIVYASTSRTNNVKIPKDLESIKKVVEDYEKYLDTILLEIRKEYTRRFPTGKNLTLVSNSIFKKLNLIRL
jgi:hypothetical protein